MLAPPAMGMNRKHGSTYFEESDARKRNEGYCTLGLLRRGYGPVTLWGYRVVGDYFSLTDAGTLDVGICKRASVI